MIKEREERKIIRRLADVIAGSYKPEKIILFGSYAYGQPDDESDIDLLIIKKTTRPFFERLCEVRRIASDVRWGCAFEPIVMTPGELKDRVRVGDQFIDEILAKGEVLYARR